MPAATRERTPARPPVRLVVGALHVTFEWTGDRWRHRVEHGGRPLVESVEGAGPDGDPRWPASPALQEVSSGDAGGRPVILAVGSAGRSHFSASVTAHEDLPDTVLVEVACRIVEPGGWLGSTYRDSAGATSRLGADRGGAAPLTVRWSYRIGPGGVAAEPPPRA